MHFISRCVAAQVGYAIDVKAKLSRKGCVKVLKKLRVRPEYPVKNATVALQVGNSSASVWCVEYQLLFNRLHSGADVWSKH